MATPGAAEVTSSSPYGTNARDYLRRARARLDEGRAEALFYAALELRAGIEARMHQYLEAQEDVSRKKKRGWKVAVLGRELERQFRTADMVVEITIHEATTGTPKATLYYTPVTRALRKQAEQLGSYLHSTHHRASDDPWWSTFRATLESAYEGLNTATKGVLLGPPLRRPGTQIVSLNREVLPNEDDTLMQTEFGTKGETVVMNVQRLTTLPKT